MYNFFGENMIVKNVRFVNNKVEIILDNTSFFVSKENYIENPVAIDSSISVEQINFMLEYDNVIRCKEKIIKLLNRKVLSEYEVYKILKEDNLKEKPIEDLVSSLKRIGLINDEYAAVLAVEKNLIKRKGRLEIVKALREKRIDEKIIDKVLNDIDEEEYKANFIKVCEKYNAVYSKRSYQVRYNLIFSKLKEYGYEDYLINEIKIEHNEADEIKLARIQLNKILKNKDVSSFNYQNINKIKSKLAMKGFSYDIINCVLGEVINRETY